MSNDLRLFDHWAKTVADTAAERLVGLLPPGATPTLQGEGQAITTGQGYRSHYVGLTTARLGPTAVWLFAVPAGHDYSDSTSQDRLGAGLMKDANNVVPNGGLGPSALLPAGGFRWRSLNGGWQGYLRLIDADVSSAPTDAADQLADIALDALTRAKLIR